MRSPAAGATVNVGTPLRPNDTDRLGPYQLLRRLGEGGMGTVYLGRSRAGKLVAIKIIRGEYANEPEFRHRFRGEVATARTVPPFCTAEVIDADPDHETPYLVVEYVDGPSLSQAVAESGPLSPSNLHALAIGVATALTAIHGTGIIHRDLKPSNVLLAPGSPKVIDFGIARAAAAVTSITRTDQFMGTVAYMAPERLEPAAAEAVTAAADIFSWGAVVAYAANGYPPFHSESPAATAIAILTGEADLGTLGGPLRDLVRRALDNDPARRPTARGLLDELLSSPVPATDAGTVTGRGTASVTGTGPVPTDEALTTGVARARITLSGASSRPRRRIRWRTVATAGLILALLATGGTLAGVLTGVIAIGPARAAVTTTGPERSAPTIPAGFPRVYLQDPLTKPVKGHWRSHSDDGHGYNASCTYGTNGYDATIDTIGSSNTWRCGSPSLLFSDFQINVDVTLDLPGSCAGVWFRFAGDRAGYALQVCETSINLGLHSGTSPTLQPFAVYHPTAPLVLGNRYRFSIIARGTTYSMLQCDVGVAGCAEPRLLGQASDTSLPNPGTIQLGVFEPLSAGHDKRYQVTFANIEIATEDQPGVVTTP